MFNSSWRRRPRLLWLIVVCVLIGLDQVSKAYFASTIILNSAVQLTSWLNLVHVLNEGAVIVWILLSFSSTPHFSAGTAPSKAEP